MGQVPAHKAHLAWRHDHSIDLCLFLDGIMTRFVETVLKQTTASDAGLPCAVSDPNHAQSVQLSASGSFELQTIRVFRRKHATTSWVIPALATLPGARVTMAKIGSISISSWPMSQHLRSTHWCMLGLLGRRWTGQRKPLRSPFPGASATLDTSISQRS